MEIDFSKKIASDDVLQITGICELKNGSKINFNYEYKIAVTPLVWKFLYAFWEECRKNR